MVETIMITTSGLIYSKGEGKVRREWAWQICNDAGLSLYDLEKDVWHEIRTS